nr:NAD(P)H-binding protein [Phycisphaerales bacterium]
MSTHKTVAVAGSTGFVGREVVRRLLADGYAVRALARDRSKAGEVLPAADQRVEIVSGDATDPACAADLLRGCEACINLIGIIRETPGVSFERAHVRTVQVLAFAAREARCRRFLQMSALGVGHDGIGEYQRSKWNGEQVVRSSGIPWTIFRPGLIHGPGGAFMQLAASWASGESAPWFFLPYFSRRVPDAVCPLGTAPEVDPVVAPVAVEDVARAFSKAIGVSEAIGEIYNLVGPETLAWPDLLRLVRDSIPDANHGL